jgi:hypothetical protein
MGDMKEQERERAARGDAGIDGDRTRTATDDDEVGGEEGKALALDESVRRSETRHMT